MQGKNHVLCHPSPALKSADSSASDISEIASTEQTARVAQVYLVFLNDGAIVWIRLVESRCAATLSTDQEFGDSRTPSLGPVEEIVVNDKSLTKGSSICHRKSEGVIAGLSTLTLRQLHTASVTAPTMQRIAQASSRH